MKEDARKWKKMSENVRKCKKMKENERKCAFFFEYWIAAKKRNSRMSNFLRKNKEVPKGQKNGPFKNVHFFLEKTGEPPSKVWFSRGQSAFLRMFIIAYGIVEPPGRLLFFLRRRANFLRMCIISVEKRGVTLPRDLRGTCEGPESGEERKVFIELRWREKRLDWGASAVSSRALNWRIWYEGKTWPTRRPPYTTLNLIITRMCTTSKGKSDDEPMQSK